MLRSLKSHLSHARTYFTRGERAHVTVLGSKEAKAGFRTIYTDGVLIATNKRLIFFAKRTIGQEMEVYPYDCITPPTTTEGLMNQSVSFLASGTPVKISRISEGNVRALVKRVRIQMEAASKPRALEPNDPISRIAELARLRDDGAITKEEFEAKKTELLSRI